MEMRNLYRVASDNSVLNYYRSRNPAEQYLRELAIYSPDVRRSVYVEKYDEFDDIWVRLPEKGKS